jgi:hypothetical protein
MVKKFENGELVSEKKAYVVIMKVTSYSDSDNKVNCKWRENCQEYTGKFEEDQLISRHRDERILANVIRSFRDFALNDIKIFVEKNWPIGGFILASCFIDQLSNYVYGQKSNQNFRMFVENYLPKKYHDLKLYEDLRNKLVHNYSLGEKYLLISGRSDLHLQPQGCQFYLNLNDFVKDLEDAFDEFRKQVFSNPVVKENAFKWHSMENEIISVV